MPQPLPQQPGEPFVSGSVAITVGGQPLNLTMSVPANPKKAREMLPILHSLTNTFVDIGIKQAEASGRHVSCKKGCGACCRQLVPLAEIEARALAQLVEALPEPRRSELRTRFEKALQRATESGLLDRLQAIEKIEPDENPEFAIEYFSAQIPCPFLEEESCSIHEQRPMACREYLVFTPPEECARPTTRRIGNIQIPLLISATARAFRSDSAASKTGWLPLILSLDWVAAHPDEGPSKPGPEWMNELFKNLKGPTNAEPARS